MQANNNEWLSSFLLMLSSPRLPQCCRCCRVPEELWMLSTTEHRGWHLREPGRGLHANQREKSVSNQLSVTGWSGVRRGNARSLPRAQGRGHSGEVLRELIHTAVTKTP